MLRSLHFCLFLLFFLIPPASAASSSCDLKPLKGLYFRPYSHQSSFWNANGKFIDAVAANLNIELTNIPIDEVHRNRFGFYELIKESIDKRNKPDFIISIFYAKGEENLLSLLDSYDVPFFTVNTSLDEPTLNIIGRPRERFKNWIGHISPDESLGGANLVESLTSINHGKNMAVFAATHQSAVNNHRVEVMMARAELLGVNVIPPVTTDWTTQSAIKAAQTLFRRVSDFDMIWTAGPDIAEGVVQVLQQSEHLKANKNLVMGTFDWSSSAINLVQKGTVDVSYGGHFMESGWALLLMHDYLAGLDYQADVGNLLSSELKAIDKTNVNEISELLANDKWKSLDFRQYSKCYNQNLERYKFSILD